MNIEAVKRAFDKGLYLPEEAQNLLEANGLTAIAARKYLDGESFDAISVQKGAAKSNFLILRD